MVEIILAQPRGFCAGVERAIETVEKAIEKYGIPIYVRHEIVHNKYVVEGLKRKGAIFVDELSEVPEGAVVIFSAHGISQKVEDEAKARKLPFIDATCPLVTKVHIEARRSEQEGNRVILIGHRGHPEMEGTAGRVKRDVLIVSTVGDVEQLEVSAPHKLSYVTQTTLSLADTADIIESLKKKFPNIVGPSTKDICYATQNRQNAVKELASQVDLVLVIGAVNSSNSNRLKDTALISGRPSYLIDGEQDIKDEWLQGVKKIGITAGASAPEILVKNVIEYLDRKLGANVTLMPGVSETLKFKLPKEVRDLNRVK
jgi:4-hydroxy-3-methylbut-2-en-1-yl diphosphate reductase